MKSKIPALCFLLLQICIFGCHSQITSLFSVSPTSVTLDRETQREIENSVWKIKNELITRHFQFTVKERKDSYGLPQPKIYKKQVVVRQELSHGTGFYISPTQIVTNFHVIDNIHQDTQLVLSHKEGFFRRDSTPIRARLLKVSSIYDLALLESIKPNHDFLRVANNLQSFQLKTTFLLFGYPGNRFIQASLYFSGSYFDGNIVEFDYNRNLGDLAGASGSPILDDQTKVIGVFHAGGVYQQEKTKRKVALAISVQALNKFLAGDNRDCTRISSEECIEQEWAHLQNASDIGYLQAQYSTFGSSYDRWVRRRQTFKHFITMKEDLNEAEKKFIQAINNLDSKARYNKRGSNYNKYKRAEENLKKAKEHFDYAVDELNQLNNI